MSILKNIAFAFFAFLPFFAYSQVHISNQGHQEAVSSFSSLATGNDSSYFSAGNDGFLIKWNADGTGEHYQITNLSIKLIAQNPANSEIAVYETDNAKVHSVSVWDWKTLQRKYIKRFSDSITSLSYTAQGSYLIVGTTALNGTFFLDAQKGSVVKKISENMPIISMAETSNSEKTCVMYSPNGNLTYYDLESGTRKARFATENALFQPTLFANNEFFAGVKDNSVFIIHATNGKRLALFSAENPILLNSKGEAETGLFFLDKQGKNIVLKYIDNIELKESIKSGRQANFKIIAQFSGFPAKDTITSAIKTADRIIPIVGEAEGMASDTNRQSGKIIFGTKSGNLYELPAVANSSVQTIKPMTDKAYQKILDVCADGTDFYILTADSVYRTAYSEDLSATAEKVGVNNGSTNLIKYGNSVILWSKDTRKEIVMLNVETGKRTPLFTPSNAIQILKIFNDELVYIQGNSAVRMYTIGTGKDTELYTGTALQDIILYNEKDLYVAKSAAENDSPLIHVDSKTRETVPVQAKGSIAYSLSHEENQKTPAFYGISVQSDANGNAKTTVFAYKPASKSYSPLLQFADEDPEAFTAIYQEALYTNIGKSQVRSYNTSSKKTLLFKRSASMPLKVARSPQMLLILNRDGSLSWYKPAFAAVVSNWYLLDGSWEISE